MRQGRQHRALVEVTNARPIPHRKPQNHVFSSLRPNASEVWKHVRQVRQIAPNGIHATGIHLAQHAANKHKPLTNVVLNHS